MSPKKCQLQEFRGTTFLKKQGARVTNAHQRGLNIAAKETVVKLLKTAHNDYRNNVIGGSLEENPKRFWSYIKRLPSTNFGIPWRHVPTNL